MHGTRDAASNWKRDWQGHLENCGFPADLRLKKLVPQQEKDNFGFDIHRNDFEVTGTKGRLLDLKKQRRTCTHSKRASLGEVRQTNIKALNRTICCGETVTLHQHDPRHIDVLVASLGLESLNS